MATALRPFFPSEIGCVRITASCSTCGSRSLLTEAVTSTNCSRRPTAGAAVPRLRLLGRLSPLYGVSRGGDVRHASPGAGCPTRNAQVGHFDDGDGRSVLAAVWRLGPASHVPLRADANVHHRVPARSRHRLQNVRTGVRFTLPDYEREVLDDGVVGRFASGDDQPDRALNTRSDRRTSLTEEQ